MAIDLEEQEQLENLKAWWKRNSTWLSNLLLAAVLSFACYSGYQWWQANQHEKAQQLSEKIDVAIIQKNLQDVLPTMQILSKDFAGNPHAYLAILKGVQAIKADKAIESIALLEDLLNREKSDNPYYHLANYRLTGLLLEQKQYDKALQWLNKMQNTLQTQQAQASNPNWQVLLTDRKADILGAKGEKQEALKTYQSALVLLQKNQGPNQINQGLTELIELKISALGL